MDVKQTKIVVDTALGPMTMFVTQDGPKLVVEPGMKYGAFVEYGCTKTSRPRPLLRPSVDR